CCRNDVVATADREGQAMAGEGGASRVGAVGVQDDVSGRVVAVLVHRVRAVAGQRRGEAHVLDGDSGDLRHRGPRQYRSSKCRRKDQMILEYMEVFPRSST